MREKEGNRMTLSYFIVLYSDAGYSMDKTEF